MPPKKGDLLKAMVAQNSSDALMITCDHMRDLTLEIMEDDWIAMSALIGKHAIVSTMGDLWNRVIIDIHRVMALVEVDVCDALLCTTQLMLLYKRCIAVTCGESTNNRITALRSKVIDFFPDNGTLSPNGIGKYSRVIPRPSADMAAAAATASDDNDDVTLILFCHRILAGFSKLMAESRADDLRNSLEFISKKKTVIVMSGGWPCPSHLDEDAREGDVCWFLWGMLMCYYGESVIHPYFTLFVRNWTKKCRNDRIGLLFGIPYVLSHSKNIISDWTYSDRVILEKVQESCDILWEECLESSKPITKQTSIKVVQTPSRHSSNSMNMRGTDLRPKTNTKTKTKKTSKKTISISKPREHRGPYDDDEDDSIDNNIDEMYGDDDGDDRFDILNSFVPRSAQYNVTDSIKVTDSVKQSAQSIKPMTGPDHRSIHVTQNNSRRHHEYNMEKNYTQRNGNGDKNDDVMVTATEAMFKSLGKDTSLLRLY